MQESKSIHELLIQYRENKLAHAFLLETDNQELCFQNLLNFLIEINKTDNPEENEKIEYLMKSENLPSLIVIRPDGQMIKKEQIADLKKNFQTKPTFSKYNMYIILEAESLNSSSANTMLKFLEEPEADILGFFICNNKENIIDTIRSRCQIVLDYYQTDSQNLIPMVWQSIAKNYLKEYELVLSDAILYNKEVLLPLIHERKELNYLFQTILELYQKLYNDTLNNVLIDEELTFVAKKGQDYLMRQIQYVIRVIDDLNYNVNIQMFLDRFVLESR